MNEQLLRIHLLAKGYSEEEIENHLSEVEDEIAEEPSDDEDDGFCHTCSGTGEGLYDGSRCRMCNGRGEL